MYTYSLCRNFISNGEWEYIHNTLSGVQVNDSEYEKFRNGTRYVTWFIYQNAKYADTSPTSGSKITRLILAESDKYNKIYTIDMTGHEPLRTMEDGTSDYIDFKTKKIVRNVGVNNGTMYKLSSVTYENISLPDIPIYEGNTAITLNQTGRLEGTYIK